MSLGKKPGKLRLADSGLGWKADAAGEPFTTPASDLKAAHWYKASRGFELKIIRNRGSFLQFDNFSEEDLDSLTSAMSEKYKIDVQSHDFAMKGWNWGKTEFDGQQLAFMVNNRNAFELPLQQVSNANLTGKQEVAVEFALPGEADDDDKDARKEARNVDQMVEMRFYIPGVVPKGEESGDDDQEMEEASAAQAFYETLKDKAEVGEIAGDAIASFSDVALLTPRYICIHEISTGAYKIVGDTMWTCTLPLCVYEARPTTIKYNIPPSLTCFYYHGATTLMFSS